VAEPYLWGLLIVDVAWLALNVWHTRENWRKADDNTRQARENLRQAEETGAALRKLRDGVKGTPAYGPAQAAFARREPLLDTRGVYRACPECSGGHPGLLDDGSGGFATCDECNGTGSVPAGVGEVGRG
jgi:hypothetical protein